MSTAQAEVALDEINALHGTRFVDAGTYEGGVVGARRVFDHDGRAYVLKLQAPGLAPQATASLRRVVDIVPRYVVVGDCYSIQEELAGRPLGNPWRVALPRPLLELNEAQAGRAADLDRSWPARVVQSVFGGYDDYMNVRTLESHSPEARELLSRCRRTVDRYAGVLTRKGDIVHGDFTAANVLAEDETVTGVIDWGGACSGDRLFDLVTWLYYAQGVDRELRRYVTDRIGEEGLAVYLAHMAVRQADWSIRFHESVEAWAMVLYGLELSRSFPR